MSAVLEERYRLDAEVFSLHLSHFNEIDLDFEFESTFDNDDDANILPKPSSGDKKVVKSVGQTMKSSTRRCRRPLPARDTSIVAALQPDRQRPNVSRRPPIDILYAFPLFDKCDSLLYFPSTFTRHLNTGDMAALTKLFYSHVTKNCTIDMCNRAHKHLSTQNLLKSYELMNEFQPDRIMCVHSTKVIENQIHASIYFKFTDSRSIFDAVVSNLSDPLSIHYLMSTSRKENLIHKLSRMQCPEAQRQQYLALAEQDVDVVLYFHLSMAIAFDDVTKKITEIRFEGKLTSMQAA